MDREGGALAGRRSVFGWLMGRVFKRMMNMRALVEGALGCVQEVNWKLFEAIFEDLLEVKL